MINFNDNSIFTLHPIDVEEVRKDVFPIFVEGEEIIAAFKTIRDQLIFTNKRMISIDVQGITGKKRSYTTMPYKNIQYFTIQTPFLVEIFADAELYLVFNNGFTATFEFKGSFDIASLGKIISEKILEG